MTASSRFRVPKTETSRAFSIPIGLRDIGGREAPRVITDGARQSSTTS